MNENQPTETSNVEYDKKIYGDLIIDSKGVKGVVLTSPDGTKYRLTVSNAGAAVFTAI